MLLGAFRGGLELKTRRVLKNSGNFLSNEHKNFIILFRNGWEKQGQIYLPQQKKKKKLKFVHFQTHKFLVSRTVSTLKCQLKTWEAFFIKWTTSVEPLIGLRSHQGSKWGHSWVILYVTNWSSPCISPRQYTLSFSLSRDTWKTDAKGIWWSRI